MGEESYRNLIVGQGDEPVDSILFNQNNWRVHPFEQQEALEGIFEDVGVVQRIIINLRTSPEWGASQNVKTLVDGHARVKIFAQHEEPTIPALYIDANPREEALILASLDPIGGMAVTDREKLSSLLTSLQTENENLNEMFTKMSGQYEDYAVDYDKVENLEDYDEPEISLRVIIEFEDEEEEDAFYERVGIKSHDGKVRYKYSELNFGDEEETGEDEEDDEDVG